MTVITGLEGFLENEIAVGMVGNHNILVARAHLDISHHLCTVQYVLWGVPGIRPDTRCVSKARLLSQTSADVDEADCRIIALMQGCSRGLHSYISAQ